MKIIFVSLGCDKNLVDSEVMLSLLQQRNYEITDDEREADIAVINTCCFIHDAKEESIQTILEFAQMKKTGSLKGIIVTGCLSERYRAEMEEELPEVDAILGTASYDQIAEAADRVAGGGHAAYFEDVNRKLPPYHQRILTTGGHYAYLKIAEGCDKHCTYCIIPSIRGSYRSVPMEDLIEEAAALVQGGVRELILVAQETTLYGLDLYGEKKLHELLKKLCEIEKLDWIRILYCYPEEITQEFIDVLGSEPKICHYLDIPIQHASDLILKRMGRRTSQKQLRELVARLRQQIPDIALRTTLISGFPGETEKDHEELLRFVKELRFDRLGVFEYSPEEDTPAAEMENQIEPAVKELRRNELMELQQQITAELGKEKIGKEYEVLIEGSLPEDCVYVGRTYMDAPGVDGFIFVRAPYELMSGDMVRVRVTGSAEYDLDAEVIEPQK